MFNRIFLVFLFLFQFIIFGFSETDELNLTIDNLRKTKISQQEIKIIKEISSNKNYKQYIISYKSEDLNINALMNIPQTKNKDKKFPVIIVNHGYIPPDKYSTINSYKLICGYFASNGFLVLKSDYRGHADSDKGEGRPMDSLKYVLDILYLIEGVYSIPQADEKNIFLWGHSMGGEITLKALEISQKVKSASLWAPVSASFPENQLYFIRKRNKEEADNIYKKITYLFDSSDFKLFSPIENLNYIKVPLIIHHGTKDESVPYDWTIELNKGLDKAGVKYTFYSYKNEDHNFSKKYFYIVLKKDVEFFNSFIDNY
ncbi:MAG: hypothetical protein A2086_15655 [Spirochaetes bacterium GWD1_27_9]|nr:MAG: hypothetical protein A2Z98_14185 [Spirochaetes bacterium GWB1_27_13]OHD22483.1 MAG: hypothetical protein A2Y34_06690 [Spirochaetes bacterium GWC1_27_15]OHD42817.1 MAG: hypothetical protein A2086_15655 [Spirochaetes bacterium GWD1_27_9]